MPYLFADIPADADERPAGMPADSPDATLLIPTRRLALPVGDYSIFGAPQVVIERKSKEDLYGSVSTTKARDNFESRLKRMCDDYAFAMVLVESEWSDLLGEPPAFTKFSPKALFRTVLAWQQKYPLVHWLLMPGREAAEVACYRVLDRFWAVACRGGDPGELELLDAVDKQRGIVRAGGYERYVAEVGRATESGGFETAEGRAVGEQLDAMDAMNGIGTGR